MQFIKRLIHGCAALAASYWVSFSTKGKIWLVLGLVAVVVDAKLCYEYGVTQTTWHGIGFAVVALFFSQLPDGAYEEFEKGNKGAGIVLALLCIPLGAVAYQSHIGFGAGVRMGDMKKASLQQTRYEDGRENVTENKRNVEIWTKQLAGLVADKQAVLDANPWSSSVKADALRNEMTALNDRMKAEEAGGRGRKAGKGKEFERLQDEATAVSKRIATVEKTDELTRQAEELTVRIAATQRLIADYRSKSETTDAGFSSVANQTEANTQLFGVLRAAYTGEPLEAAMKTTEQSARLANLLITAAGSLAFMLMAPIGFFMANRNKRKETFAEQNGFTPIDGASAPATERYFERVETKIDEGMKAIVRQAMAGSKLAQRNQHGRAAA